MTLLAATRLGLTFTVVFSGFSADSLSTKINDLGRDAVITADGFYRRGKQVLLKDIADQALEQTPSVKNVIMVRRLGVTCPIPAGRAWALGNLLAELPEAASGPPAAGGERAPSSSSTRRAPRASRRA